MLYVHQVDLTYNTHETGKYAPAVRDIQCTYYSDAASAGLQPKFMPGVYAHAYAFVVNVSVVHGSVNIRSPVRTLSKKRALTFRDGVVIPSESFHSTSLAHNINGADFNATTRDV